MIQRIQSVFLFVSLCLLCSAFFVPVAEVGISDEFFAFNLSGFYRSEGGPISYQYSIMAFGMLICALNLVTIFMYRRRVLQLRLCVYNMLLLAGLCGVALFTLYNVQNVHSVAYRLPAVFPVIAIILHYMAFRGIRRDELMVQALSRLR